MKLNLVLIVLLSISLNVNAQDVDKHSFWCQVGIGAGIVKFENSKGSLNFKVAGNYEINNNNLSFSILHCSEISFFTSPQENISSYELKYGRSFNIFNSRSAVYAKAGIAYLQALNRTTLLHHELLDNYYNSTKSHSLGFPVEVGIRIVILKFLAYDISAQTTINSIKSYSSVNMSWCIGSF